MVRLLCGIAVIGSLLGSGISTDAFAAKEVVPGAKKPRKKAVSGTSRKRGQTREVGRLRAEVRLLRAALQDRSGPGSSVHRPERDLIDAAAVDTITRVASREAVASENLNRRMGFSRTRGVFVPHNLQGPTRIAAREAIQGQLNALGMSYLTVLDTPTGFNLRPYP